MEKSYGTTKDVPVNSKKEMTQSFINSAREVINRINNGDVVLAEKIRNSLEERVLTEQPQKNPKQRYEALLNEAE